MNKRNPLPASLKNHGIILFDGDCPICNGWVRWIIKQDSRGYYRFGSLQSEESKWLSQRFGVPFFEFDSVILIEQGRYFTQSTAVLRILRRMNRFSVPAFMFLLIPRFFRDLIYQFVAKNRHRWNQGKQTCPIPTPEQQKRFLNHSLKEEASFDNRISNE